MNFEAACWTQAGKLTVGFQLQQLTWGRRGLPRRSLRPLPFSDPTWGALWICFCNPDESWSRDHRNHLPEFIPPAAGGRARARLRALFRDYISKHLFRALNSEVEQHRQLRDERLWRLNAQDAEEPRPTLF